ncbi:MAG: flagellar biosynthesis protein FlgA [Magnetospirillum sp. WYHS-4]
MALHRMLLRRAAESRPIRVGLIGAGQLGAAFLAQALRAPGLHVMAVADRSVEQAWSGCMAAGWEAERCAATSFAKAQAQGSTFLTDDAEALINAGGIELIVEATAQAAAGIRHALAAFRRGRHVVMANLQADALAGPLLARRAGQARTVYTLAYGGVPASLGEMVDWARACGFPVVAAGRGTAYWPDRRKVDPATAWNELGLTAEEASTRHLSLSTAVSALDGTQAALEMACSANAVGLDVAPSDLAYLPCAMADLPVRLLPKDAGGMLDAAGRVVAVSGRDVTGQLLPGGLGDGTFLVLEASSKGAGAAFSGCGLAVAPDGRHAALWRPCRLPGAEIAISVASAVLRGEATGTPGEFRAEVTTFAKRGLDAGETLDGEGGRCVYGRAMAAGEALARGYLPLGLAAGARLKTHIAVDHPIRWFDVDVDPQGDIADILSFRHEMEKQFAGRTANTAAV